MACGEYKHPLQRGGTSQPQRLSAALCPEFARVDEKDLSDWIVYADALSAYIKFYNLNNGVQGDWQPFFSQSITAVLAGVATLDPNALQGFGERLDFLRRHDEAAHFNDMRQKLAELFGAGITFAKALDRLVARLPLESPLRRLIINLISAKLGPALQRLRAYHLAAKAANFLMGGSVPTWKILGLPVSDAETALGDGLSGAWPNLTAVTADASIFTAPTVTSDPAKIRHAANHNLFTAVFDQIQMAYARLLKEAKSNLQATLEDWGNHPPQFALFLSFLKLLKEVQTDLNRFTTRHLDFYYRDVLRLKPRSPGVDNAYVVIELAKSVPSFLLAKDTQFRAGKDSLGNELYYRLSKDVTFNKATIGKLMAVYQGTERDNLKAPALNNDKRLFAAPVINSADGLGSKLITAQGDWHPFVNRTYLDGVVKSIDEPLAAIGFAIASHYLALAEGQRTITIRLATNNNSVITQLDYEVFLTTEKGWLQVSGPAPVEDAANGVAKLTISVPPSAPAITNYDAKVHRGTFGVALPVAKVVLKNDPSAPYKYESFRDIKVTSVGVAVEVGSISSGTAVGAKQLVLANSSGPVDPAKPFLAFGPQPDAGDSLIVGSKEIFSKAGVRIKFTADWIKLPEAASHIVYPNKKEPSTSLEFLTGGEWEQNGSPSLFDELASPVVFPSTPVEIPPESVVAYDEPFAAYSNQSRGGFLRIRLNESFGHKKYLFALTTYLINLAQTPSDDNASTIRALKASAPAEFVMIEPQAKLAWGAGAFGIIPSETTNEPKEPYTPTLQSFSISYKASASETLTGTDVSAFENRSIRFFHVYPFGEAEQHHQLTSESFFYLMPQFRTAPSDGSSGAPAENQAEFYLGLQTVLPGESVSILFQMLEGSSDPQVLKPDDHVYFSYLANNVWKPIAENLVSDGTNQLIQSGLVEFPIPTDASANNTILPAGYIWIRLSVQNTADAICRIIAVLPQAALVTAAAPWLKAPLPPGTIAKLKDPVTAVKSIKQLYTSFRTGGGGETTPLFYARVSERLRHKNRAISIWDYERLVLQAFPQIHKVKCLSHTRLVDDPTNPGSLICHELAPGHVLVVTIPDLATRNDANPLRPYTNAGVIAEIQAYLRARATCHAEVTVANPLFEEIRTEFLLTLAVGYTDAAYYTRLLQDEITAYLTPWAFGGQVDIQFGGKVHKSTLINFIEERPYVDFITEVKLFHRAGDKAPEAGDMEEAIGSTARSILVSAPASKHNITIVPREDTTLLTEECDVHG